MSDHKDITWPMWFWLVVIPAASFYGTLLGRFLEWLLEAIYS